MRARAEPGRSHAGSARRRCRWSRAVRAGRSHRLDLRVRRTSTRRARASRARTRGRRACSVSSGSSGSRATCRRASIRDDRNRGRAPVLRRQLVSPGRDVGRAMRETHAADAQYPHGSSAKSLRIRANAARDSVVEVWAYATRRTQRIDLVGAAIRCISFRNQLGYGGQDLSNRLRGEGAGLGSRDRSSSGLDGGEGEQHRGGWEEKAEAVGVAAWRRRDEPRGALSEKLSAPRGRTTG